MTRRPPKRLLVATALLMIGILAMLAWVSRTEADSDTIARMASIPLATAPTERLPEPLTPATAAPTPMELAASVAQARVSAEAATAAAPTPKVALVVVDADDAPVSGAEINGPELTTKPRTNDDGYVAISPPRVRPRDAKPDALTVTLSAYDFCPQTLALPLPAPSLTRVALVRAAWLDVRVMDAAGPLADSLQVEIVETRAAGAETRQHQPVPRLLGVDEAGRCLINGVTPGSPMSLSILDRYGTRVVPAQALTLGEGEHRRVDLLLGSDPRELIVSVRDESGGPVADARVGLVRAGEKHLDVPTEIVEKTDGSGRAVFSWVGLPSVDAQAVAAGHGLAFEQGIDLVAQTTFVEMRLGPPSQVDVRVVDAAGRPYAPDFVGVLDLPMPVVGEARAFGRYRLSDLPSGSVQLSVLQQGRRFDVMHDTAVPTATITVDSPGRLIVRCELTPAELEDHSVALRVQQGTTDAGYFGPDSGHLEGQFAVLGFDGLLPGAWQVSLVWAWPTEPITDVVPVTITSNETASITLTRR
jgi:hypothetical protein